jgi:hypothetical protein
MRFKLIAAMSATQQLRPTALISRQRQVSSKQLIATRKTRVKTTVLQLCLRVTILRLRDYTA